MENSDLGPLFNEEAQRIILAHYGLDEDFLGVTEDAETPVAPGVPYFTDETRMPIPEKSYFQELLDQPIPLANRIAHFVPYLDIEALPPGTVNSEYTIAEQIGSTPSWVRGKALEIGLEVLSEEVDQNGAPYSVYDSPALELLREEWWWHSETRTLGELVQLKEFERLLGKTEDWAMKYAHELGVMVEYVPSKSGGRARVLPRTALHQLRHIILMFLPQQDWYTEHELSVESGHDARWLVAHLGRVGVNAELRWSDLTGKLLNFYPPESPSVIQEIEASRPKSAGNWLSAVGIAHKVDMTYEWTTARLREIQDPTAEMRLNDFNVPKLHYSPQTIARVEALAIEAKSVSEAGDWYSVSGLARVVGMSEPWVRRRLPFLVCTPERRRDPDYRIFMYYPPDAIGELKRMQGIKLSDLRTGNF